MKTRPLTVAACAGLLLTACIPSVNPFYTADDVTFEPALVGEWTTRDKSKEPQHWKFEGGEDKAYALTVTDDEGRLGYFKATLFRLQDHRFLDLIPTKCEYATNQVELVGLAIIPGHLLVHVAQVEPELKMAFCDFDWLEKHLKKNPQALAHVGEGEPPVVLTASTAELQQFLMQHLATGELFSEYGELTRDAAPQPESQNP
jgi:hypothetical protein